MELDVLTVKVQAGLCSTIKDLDLPMFRAGIPVETIIFLK